MDKLLTVSEAVALRTRQLMVKHGLTQYALEKKSTVTHGCLCGILQNTNKTVTLSTIMLLAQAFGLSVQEFLSPDIFDYEKIEIN